jgi:hypothetical protein
MKEIDEIWVIIQKDGEKEKTIDFKSDESAAKGFARYLSFLQINPTISYEVRKLVRRVFVG